MESRSQSSREYKDKKSGGKQEVRAARVKRRNSRGEQEVRSAGNTKRRRVEGDKKSEKLEIQREE